jgi:hypothetical protein
MMAASPSESPVPPTSSHEGSRLFRRLVFVALFLEVGLLLVVLPWSGFWDRNYFGFALPGLRPFITNNFVRGAVTGLGVVNLLAGLTELMLLFAGRGRQHAP